ncbi:MAG: hypothetical protein PHR75_03085 [Sulfurovum sp.]|nr:hypothetical protein [Sulfurovum sp.]MDD3603178.1 hypothetical protein [Sulfurovum sp.]
MPKNKKRVYGALCLCLVLGGMPAHAQSVESVMQEYTQKNDLSQKTIDENKGHLVLYSREQLENMRAKTLRDVFKTTPVIYYHENRFGLPDPLTSGAFEPYRSNFIRLYIDGVEITQGWAGSGLVLYGDINIDFVDHIEFYYAIPSFETSVEPAYLTIFLYSKDPKREGGGKLGLSGGSRGYNAQTFSYAKQENEFTYMMNVAHTKEKREKIPNGTSLPLSRDFETTQLFSHAKSDDQAFHLQVMKKNADSLAGLSYDATPEASKMDYLNVHMDYGVDFDANWRAQFTYDWLEKEVYAKDDAPLLYMGFFSSALQELDAEATTSAYTGELTYHETVGKHRIAAGVKGRLKQLDRLNVQGEGDIALGFDSEAITSVFFQDQYALAENQLLTLGVEGIHFGRNGDVEDDNLMQFRLGYIYGGEHWTYKTYLYRVMFALDPLNRYLGYALSESVPAQKTLGFTQELAYTDEKQYIRLMLLLMKDEDGLVQNPGAAGDTKYFFSVLNYDYRFDVNSKITSQIYYAEYKNIFGLNSLEDISGFFTFFKRYEALDFYNGVVWHRNSLDWKNYWDWTSSVTWNVDEDLTLTLKGENLLDKAKETDLYRYDLSSGSFLSPLSISPIDRRIMLELEYMF